MDSPYWKGPLPGVDVQRRYLWKTFRGKPNSIPGSARKCSASARNPVRLHPGMLFGLPRNTQLVRSYFGMLPPHTLSASRTHAHGHVIDFHFRLGLSRYVRGGHPIGPLPFQLSRAAGAAHARHWHLDRVGPGGRRWGIAALEGSLSGLLAGAVGVGFAFAFGKWRGRPRFAPQKLSQLLHFFAQPIILRLDPSQFLAEGLVFF